ncbi:hypothetical protein KAH55_02840 [bacterium]|nr:hypothetical protein [bacterium]
MRKWFSKLFDNRSNEMLRAWLMFFYLFLIIASLLILKPVRNSLFLTSFGSHRLPYAYLLVAAAGIIVIRLYASLATRLRLNRLIVGTFFIWIGCLVLFWIAFSTDFDATWLYYLFYVWSAIFGIVSASQFWLLVNYTFNAREAKRLFGFLGTSGIFGGYLTNKLAFTMGTANLLLICLIVCVAILLLIWRHGASERYLKKSRQIKMQQIRSIRILHEFRQSPYLMYLATIGGIILLIQPVPWAAVFSKICDGSFKQSIHKSGLELLYISIPFHLKIQAKTFIDVFIDSFTTGLSKC